MSVVRQEGVLRMPPEWMFGRKWRECAPIATKDLPDGLGIVVSGVLTDDTVIFGIAWPGGQRLWRCGPPGWVVEERRDGDQREDVEGICAATLAAVIDTNKLCAAAEARGEFVDLKMPGAAA